MTLTHPPLPGSWVDTAQAALDDIAEMRDITEVQERFGSARVLTETILGFPVAGGQATRRAIRAVGQMLHNPLGPAVAAEALSWAASVSDVVDTATIELLLEASIDRDYTCRPLRLADRELLHDYLEASDRSMSRRHLLLDLWREVPPGLAWPHHPMRWDFYDDIGADEDDLLEWLENRTANRGEIPRAAICAAGDDQLELFEQATASDVRKLSSAPELFDLDEAIVGGCLSQHPGRVLDNPACSSELRSRIGHPYDRATLELAIRAGQPHYEVARVARMLADLDVAELLATMPLEYLSARRVCGQVSADDFLGGALASLDLADRPTMEASLGRPSEWPGGVVPDNVVDVLMRHPEAGALVWMLDDAFTGNVPAATAWRLVEEGPLEVGAAALRFVEGETLDRRHASVALAAGDYWSACCPSIPGSSRPVRPLPALEQGHVTPADGIPFWYPAEVEALEGHEFGEAQGWSIRLPRTPADLRRNALAMRNCSEGYVDDISDGRLYILIVLDPSGQRFNVMLVDVDGRIQVGEINSWANGGIRPEWIRPALEACLRRRPLIRAETRTGGASSSA